MHDDVNTALGDFALPERFTQTHYLDLMDISCADTPPDETPKDNGVTLPLLIQPYPPNSPPVDALEALAPSPPGTCVDASDATHILSASILPGVRLMSADDTLFSFYQDRVYQNPVTHLDGGIY